MSTPTDSLQRILDENGWSVSRTDDATFLHINGQKVRYYDYPDEKYNIEVRRMILRNTLAEMDMVLPPALNPGEALSIDELRRNVHALEPKVTKLSPETPREIYTEQALAINLFKLGGALLLDVLNKMSKGTDYETLREQYSEGLKLVAQAHNRGEFCGLEISGKPPSKSFNAQQKLALNIRDIVDFEEPVETLITSWYAKIAQIKQAMDARVATAIQGRNDGASQALAEFAQSCGQLLEARRNEPEYALAQVEAAAQLDSLKSIARHNQRALDAAQDIYWMARVREPLDHLQTQPSAIGSRYA